MSDFIGKGMVPVVSAGSETALVMSKDCHEKFIESYLWVKAVHRVLLRNNVDAGSVSTPKMSVYVERLLSALVDLVQDDLSIDDVLSKKPVVTAGRYRNSRTVKMPLSFLCAKGDVSHTRDIVEALKLLQGIVLEFDKPDGVISLRNVIVDSDVIPNSGYLQFDVHHEVWDMITDFRKGYRMTEFASVRNLHLPFSFRFYKLLVGQEGVVRYKISTLVRIFGLKDVYLTTSMFVRRILRRAQQDMYQNSSFTFGFRLASSKEARERHMLMPKGPMAKDMVLLWAVTKEEYGAGYVSADGDGGSVREFSHVPSGDAPVVDYLDPSLVELIVGSVMFTRRGLDRNRQLFVTAATLLGVQGFGDYLRSFVQRIGDEDMENPCGLMVWDLRNNVLPPLAAERGCDAVFEENSVVTVSSVEKAGEASARDSFDPSTNPYCRVAATSDALKRLAQDKYAGRGLAVPADLADAIVYFELTGR